MYLNYTNILFNNDKLYRSTKNNFIKIYVFILFTIQTWRDIKNECIVRNL